jgi:hypothetical protein
MAVKRDIKYLNRDFSDLRETLINFTRTYYPTTYNDFSPASPGMLFMEIAAYVGDVLSFYTDNQIQENFLQYARQTNNLFQLAYMFGYKPKVTGVASTTIDIYQQVPAKSEGGSYVPDFSYALYVSPNATVTANTDSSTTFLIEEAIDFSISSSLDITEVSVYTTAGDTPTFFLLKKSRQAISATTNTVTFTFGAPERFTTVEINANNIIGILDITDSDGQVWYEVDYLAQDAVFDSIKNNNINDPTFSSANDTPYILKLKSVQRRFVSRFINNTTLQLQFGAGTTNDNDAELIPNPDNIGLGLPYGRSKLTTGFDPSNFIFTNTYGIAPSNTTLTVRYLTGGGATSNVSAGTLTIFNGNITFANIQTEEATANQVFSSLAVVNPTAASGGGDGDTVEELRQNTIANYGTQLRAVTQNDYLIRALSLPPKYGTIAKAYIEPTKAQNTNIGEIPSILDLYVLTYNSTGTLTQTSNALKTNLTTYLSQYRMVGDSLRILDAFIVNIGVDFEIVTLPNYNNNLVLVQCIQTLQESFNGSKWQINQPIVLGELFNILNNVQGVQSIKQVKIVNKVGSGYSEYAYDIGGATLNNVIYPSLDPCIFEVKYPNSDITGRIVTI